MSRQSTLLLAAIGLAAAAQPAPAQTDTFLVGLHQQQFNHLTSVVNANVVRNISESGRRDAPKDRAEPPAVATSALTYSPSPSRRAANLASFADRNRARDPEGSAKMDKLFASTDVIAAAGQALKPLGMSVQNLADAYAVYWVTAWNAANGIVPDPTRAQKLAMKQQAEAAMLGVPQLASASDADKQQTAEAYLVQAMLISGVMEDTQGDKATQARIASAVKQGAKAAGLDLDQMTLTETGFVLR